jgi:alpha-tubulin suppressor-like RCC1 family protein
LSNVVAVAGGGEHSLALRNDGRVVVWGQADQTNPPPDLTNCIAIAAGSSHSVALRGDGTVVCWGTGVGTNVPAGLSNVVGIAAGGTHSLALRSDGTVQTWGSYSPGISGTPPADATNVVAIACGSEHSVALRNNGTVVAWGAGLPDYEGFPNYTQSTVPDALCGVVAIAAGGRRTIALYSGIPRPFTLSGATWLTNRTFRCQLYGEANRFYRFQVSSNFHDWTEAGSVVFPITSEFVNFTDSAAYQNRVQFYRVVTE